eukprot:5510901-Prymnesium_polylepis.1
MRLWLSSHPTPRCWASGHRCRLAAIAVCLRPLDGRAWMQSMVCGTASHQIADAIAESIRGYIV